MHTIKFLITLLLELFFNVCFAAGVPPGTIDAIAQNTTDVFGLMANFLTAIAYVIGFSFCIAALIQYNEHRNNPTHVHLTKPILLLIFGLALVALPFIAGIMGHRIFSN